MTERQAIRLEVPAKIRSIAFDAADLLDLAKSRAQDPTVFDGEKTAAFWRAEISSTRRDYYHTRMHAGTTLKNFAENATEGISFLHGHDTMLRLGQSLQGQVIDDDKVDEEGVALSHVEVDFFTLRGLRLNPHIDTDSFIDSVRAGIAKDVSVGFSTDNIRCGICNAEMVMGWFGGIYSWDCDHIPGEQVAVVDSDGNAKLDANGDPMERTAFAWIYDGRLHETSDVYDGATPGAGFLKARAMAEAGQLAPERAIKLERVFGRSLPNIPRIFAAPNVGDRASESTGGREVATTKKPAVKRDADPVEKPDAVVPPVDDTTQPVVEEVPDPEPKPDFENEVETDEEDTVLPTIDELAGSPECDEDGNEIDPVAVATADEGERTQMASFRRDYDSLRQELGEKVPLGTDPIKALRSLSQRYLELQPLAVAGKRYGNDLVDQAVKAGIRAKAAIGRTFNEDLHRSQLKRMADNGETESLRLVITEWLEDGDAALRGANPDSPVGGRTISENPSLIDDKTPITPVEPTPISRAERKTARA